MGSRVEVFVYDELRDWGRVMMAEDLEEVCGRHSRLPVVMLGSGERRYGQHAFNMLFVSWEAFVNTRLAMCGDVCDAKVAERGTQTSFIPPKSLAMRRFMYILNSILRPQAQSPPLNPHANPIARIPQAPPFLDHL